MRYPRPMFGDEESDLAAQWDFVEAHAARIHFFDAESTGADVGRSEVLTLSVGSFTWPGLERVSEFEIRMKPDYLNYWDKGAEEVHKIPREKAMLFTPKEEAWEKTLEYLEGASVPGAYSLFACHSMRVFNDETKTLAGYFDWSLIRMELEMRGGRQRFDKLFPGTGLRSTIDYYRAAANAGHAPPAPLRRTQSGRMVPNYKLSALCGLMGIELNHHEAKSDRKACEKIFIEINQRGDQMMGVFGDYVESPSQNQARGHNGHREEGLGGSGKENEGQELEGPGEQDWDEPVDSLETN